MSKILIILLFVILSASCGQKFKTTKHGLTVTGKIGELLIVCEAAIWDSELKNCLDSSLTKCIPPYFPAVSSFKLVHKTPTNFNNGNKRWRNVLMLEINANYNGKNAKITKEENTWANGQLLIRIKANSYSQLKESCIQNLKLIHTLFDTKEWKRILQSLQISNQNELSEKIKKKFGFKIVLPKGSIIVSQRTNFYRIEFPAKSKSMQFDEGNGQISNFIQSGICIYQYPYSDSSQFALKSLLRDRDTMLKYNVPHEVKGVYMGTQYHELVYPQGEFTENNHTKAFEMRGMFQFSGNNKFKTGGAFWALHFKNKRGQLVCVSGYVDAPPTISWIIPLREIQAILKSVELD